MPFSSTEIIRQLQLKPLPPEGGYFRRSYTTSQTIDLKKGYRQPLGTGIYFLLQANDISAFHWLKEDKIYHFYLGDPVELFELSPEQGLKRTELGPDLAKGQHVQYPVLKNRWHGSRLITGGEWALLGTTMAPGFTWEDFELGKREHLLSEYPAHKDLILELTRTTDEYS